MKKTHKISTEAFIRANQGAPNLRAALASMGISRAAYYSRWRAIKKHCPKLKRLPTENWEALARLAARLA